MYLSKIFLCGKVLTLPHKPDLTKNTVEKGENAGIPAWITI